MEGMRKTNLPEIEYNPEWEYVLQMISEKGKKCINPWVYRVGEYNSGRAREILWSEIPDEMWILQGVGVDGTTTSQDWLVVSVECDIDIPVFPSDTKKYGKWANICILSETLKPEDVRVIRNSIKNALLVYFSEWFRYLTRLPRKWSNGAIEMSKRSTQQWKYTDDNFPYPVFYQLVRESESWRYGDSRILQLMFSLYEKKQLSINGNEKHLQFSLPPDIMNWLEWFEFDAFMTLYCEWDVDLDVFWEKRHFLWKPFLNVPVLRWYSRPVFTSKVLKPEIIERLNELLKQACIQVVREVQSYQQSLE